MKACLYFLLLSLLVTTGNAQQQPLFDVSFQGRENGKETFEEIRKLILENYYYEGINENDLYWASIDGMLRHISPPDNPKLATLWSSEEYEKILNSLKGVRVSLGFGSSFDSRDGSLTITSITTGSDAEKKLQLHDRIVRIDKEVLAGKKIEEVNKLLDGEVGSAATLKVVRDIKVFDIQLKRDTLKAQNLTVTKVPNSTTALVEFKTISLGIAGELETALARLKEENIATLILDFRNSTGGVLNEGINVAKLFMKKGNYVLKTQSRSNGVVNYAAEKDGFTDFELAVLINENTASSSEIIVSALRDHNRAIIIGEKSFGKGVIENTYTLSNNYRVKFISNVMYSPKGVSWQAKGLLPDYIVNQTQDTYNTLSKLSITDKMNSDLYLNMAVKLLRP